MQQKVKCLTIDKGGVIDVADPQAWARKINASMADSVAAIIATGQAFIDAKKTLKHGEFERMFANHADPLPEPVACSHDTAKRLMAVARNPALSNGAHAPLLPPSWTTLYELTKLPEDKLETAITEGWVKPDTQRADVKEIRERLGVDAPKKKSAPQHAEEGDDSPFNEAEDRFIDGLEEKIVKEAMKLASGRVELFFTKLRATVKCAETRVKNMTAANMEDADAD